MPITTATILILEQEIKSISHFISLHQEDNRDFLILEIKTVHTFQNLSLDQNFSIVFPYFKIKKSPYKAQKRSYIDIEVNNYLFVVNNHLQNM